MKLAFAFGGIACVICWFLGDKISMNDISFGIGSGFIGYFLAYIILLFRKK